MSAFQDLLSQVKAVESGDKDADSRLAIAFAIVGLARATNEVARSLGSITIQLEEMQADRL